MTKLKEMVLRLASGDDNILIIGEPGTGKRSLFPKPFMIKVAEVINHFTLEILLGEQSDDLINSLLWIEKGRATK